VPGRSAWADSDAVDVLVEVAAEQGNVEELRPGAQSYRDAADVGPR
jgi:hypothetical protein